MSCQSLETNYLRVNNANRGCEWVGTVGTLEKHVATCAIESLQATVKSLLTKLELEEKVLKRIKDIQTIRIQEEKGS